MSFRYVAANTHPDHDTLATFRRRFVKEVESLFVQVLELACEMKLLKLGAIAMDGTKIKANASKHKALSWAHANRIEAQLRQEVQALLALAEKSDRAALPDGMDVSAELARREERLGAIAQAKAKIAQRAAERHQDEQQQYEAKKAKRQAQRDQGNKPRGKDPEPPQAGPQDKDQVNLTDEESRIMPGSSRQAQPVRTMYMQALCYADNLKRAIEQQLQARNLNFESPYGMELLATVDWRLSQEHVEPTVPAMREGLRDWRGGPDSVARKDRLFDDRSLGIALKRLVPNATVSA